MKTKRQTKMLELIKKHNIETQEELSDYLQKEGGRVQGNSGNGFQRYPGIKAYESCHE